MVDPSFESISSCVNIGFFRPFHFSTIQYTFENASFSQRFFFRLFFHLTKFLSKSTSAPLYRDNMCSSRVFYQMKTIRFENEDQRLVLSSHVFQLALGSKFIEMFEREKQSKTLLILNFSSESFPKQTQPFSWRFIFSLKFVSI